MREREARKIADAVLALDKARKDLLKLDHIRDQAAFDDTRREAIEQDIQATERHISTIAAFLRKYRLDII